MPERSCSFSWNVESIADILQHQAVGLNRRKWMIRYLNFIFNSIFVGLIASNIIHYSLVITIICCYRCIYAYAMTSKYPCCRITLAIIVIFTILVRIAFIDITTIIR
ncbi:hypothetical protein BD408DRAFT_425969 [Parasitella parasitica]|nr:hypothetical protein BD408DRAFT_425969 [Parasitella parasitica]